jgi:hypothetical protein
LKAGAGIVACPDFENGVNKILNGELLTANEAEACKKLLKQKEPTAADEDMDDSEEDEAEEEEVGTTAARIKLRISQFKKQKTGHYNEPMHDDTYVDVAKLITATSNVCERLFSQCKHIMLPNRRGMSPALFEALMYLKVNASHWNLATVATAMRSIADDNESDSDNEIDADEEEE